MKEKLQQEFAVQPADGRCGSGSSLWRSAGPATADPTDIPLAQEIQKPENSAKARKIIVDVIESKSSSRRTAKSANYLLDCCAKAQALLAAAVKDGFRPESKLTGVAKQLDQIEAQVGKIREYIEQHAKH